MSKVIYDYDFIFKDNNNVEQNVIFCHGFNSSPNSFKQFQNYWTKTNYYALQFPGCNKTPALKDHQISIYQYAKLLIEFVKNNNLKNITLIGHSMGCMIISIAYMTDPNLFNKLIYIAPTNALKNRHLKKYYFAKDFDSYLQFLDLLYYDSSIFTSNSNWLKQAKQNFNANDFNNPVLIKLRDSLEQDQLQQDIKKAHSLINIPTLVVLGEDDKLVNRAECLDYFNKQVKNVKTCWIAKTGHMIFDENFDEFINVVEDFILD
ncbi:alpha/beta fold hydrolase [Mycoplasma yeatsii]|uniref:Pimeloyl-ACP methyl ester carboxylesterase n=1 Tax=Mycoplasma yeatsii TaxID=51365 RepID=A0ABU0NFA8_9MOLU|nr:alpha/beta hydrolase [Mycoplasma yeatsii]MDQ0568128.1 pimeloyl-ACP methyl ester carboxylesterase [Mycoplasma yeatsii]